MHTLICVAWRAAELENHLGIADKTLAEFIVELSKGKSR